MYIKCINNVTLINTRERGTLAKRSKSQPKPEQYMLFLMSFNLCIYRIYSLFNILLVERDLIRIYSLFNILLFKRDLSHTKDLFGLSSNLFTNGEREMCIHCIRKQILLIKSKYFIWFNNIESNTVYRSSSMTVNMSMPS